MSVRTGDRDEGKLTVIEASKNLIAYTYDRVHDKTLPKSDRWLTSKRNCTFDTICAIWMIFD